MKLRSLLLSIILLCSINLSYSTDRFSLNDYFDQVSQKSHYTISLLHRKSLIKYYDEHHLGPGNILDEDAIRNQRHTFNKQRKSLIKQWTDNTQLEWPTYEEDTLCKIDGQCYWKRPGDFFDAHHIFPLSHKGPNHWLNIWPIETNNHTTLHTVDGPCCDIFPHSCGNRGRDIDTSAFFTGWKESGQSRSRTINGKDVLITKVQYKTSKHYYKIKVGENAGGESYKTLDKAKKAAIAQAFSN